MDEKSQNNKTKIGSCNSREFPTRKKGNLALWNN